MCCSNSSKGMKDTLVQGQSLLMIKKVWPLFFFYVLTLGDYRVVCTLFVSYRIPATARIKQRSTYLIGSRNIE